MTDIKTASWTALDRRFSRLERCLRDAEMYSGGEACRDPDYAFADFAAEVKHQIAEMCQMAAGLMNFTEATAHRKMAYALFYLLGDAHALTFRGKAYPIHECLGAAPPAEDVMKAMTYMMSFRDY